MTACRPDPAATAVAGDPLQRRPTADGSLTLWSERFGECFHSGSGALSEAMTKFIAPAQLERFPRGSCLRVLDVGVGLGYNTAALLEAAAQRDLQLEWIGLELDPRPLALALKDTGFRRWWQPRTLQALEQLQAEGAWRSSVGPSSGDWYLGDARQQLPAVLKRWPGRCDLVLHDAFSPGRCPELWTADFLAGLAGLLQPSGRLLSYCAAAAVRRGLQEAGLELASIAGPGGPRSPRGVTEPAQRRVWCQGTAASPTPLLHTEQQGTVLRPLSVMEQEHLLTRAGVPYRDPSGQASAAAIQAERAARQQHHRGESTSAWRRRWGLDRQGSASAGEPGRSA